jgi:8-oxo-dGTP pyrophosphatase MutT (NUDIX family)
MNYDAPHSTIIAVHALLKMDNKLLFVERRGSRYWDGYYSVVAGHLENNETILSCLRREVFEEIGIELPEQTVSLVHIMNRAASDGPRLDFFFEAPVNSGATLQLDPREIASQYIGQLNDIESRVVPYVRKAIEYVNQGVKYSWFTDVLFPEHQPS